MPKKAAKKKTAKKAATKSSRTKATHGIIEGLSRLAVPVETLNLDPRNARRHGDRNLETIVSSFREFGQRSPIVVQREGMIVRAGNGRLEAARRLGWTHVAAVVVDEDDVAATAFAIADNRSAELATWDDDTLAELLQQVVEASEITIDDMGFDDGELAALIDKANKEAEAPDAFKDPELGESDYRCPSCQYEWNGQPRPPKETPR